MFKKITLSVIVVLTLIIIKQNVSTGNTQPEVLFLPGTSGFEPATTITDAEAYEFANNYKTVFGKGEEIASGGVITREALDAILDKRNCNAVSYKLCIDPSGRFAPANTVFLVLSGAKVSVNNTGTIVEDVGSSKYTSKQWCPPACMKFMIRNAAGELVPVE